MLLTVANLNISLIYKTFFKHGLSKIFITFLSYQMLLKGVEDIYFSHLIKEV